MKILLISSCVSCFDIPSEFHARMIMTELGNQYGYEFKKHDLIEYVVEYDCNSGFSNENEVKKPGKVKY